MAPYKQVKLPKPGPSALVIITDAVRDGVVTVESHQQGVAANKSVSNGYLTRDKKDGKTYYPTDRAREMLAMLEGIAEPGDMQEHETQAAVVPVADASGLVATVERARALLDDGDIINARIVASVAYNQAKTAAQFAEQIGATEKLIAKARRMQADALLIEARAKILIADKWDEAQASGEASKGGRPKTLSDGKGFSVDDTGLSYKEKPTSAGAISSSPTKKTTRRSASGSTLIWLEILRSPSIWISAQKLPSLACSKAYLPARS